MFYKRNNRNEKKSERTQSEALSLKILVKFKFKNVYVYTTTKYLLEISAIESVFAKVILVISARQREQRGLGKFKVVIWCSK